MFRTATEEYRDLSVLSSMLGEIDHGPIDVTIIVNFLSDQKKTLARELSKEQMRIGHIDKEFHDIISKDKKSYEEMLAQNFTVICQEKNVDAVLRVLTFTLTSQQYSRILMIGLKALCDFCGDSNNSEAANVAGLKHKFDKFNSELEKCDFSESWEKKIRPLARKLYNLPVLSTN